LQSGLPTLLGGVAGGVPPKRTYTEDELQAALKDIQTGKLGTRRAAVIYGIPRSTLRNKVYKMANDRRKMSNASSTSPAATTANGMNNGASTGAGGGGPAGEGAGGGKNGAAAADAGRNTPNLTPATTPHGTPLGQTDLLDSEVVRSSLAGGQGAGATGVSESLRQLLKSTISQKGTLLPSPAASSASSGESCSPPLGPLAPLFMGGVPGGPLGNMAGVRGLTSPLAGQSDPVQIFQHFFSSIHQQMALRGVLPTEQSLLPELFKQFSAHDRLLDEQVNLMKEPLCNGANFASLGVGGLRAIGNSLHGSNGLGGFGLGAAEELDSKIRSTARLAEQGAKTPAIAGALAGGVGEQLNSRNVVKSEKQLGMAPNSNTSNGSSNQKKPPQQVGADGKVPRPKRGRYRNYNRDNLLQAVNAVQRGEMSVHRAGTYFGVPHSTLEYKVKERHLLRPKKRAPRPQNSQPGGPSTPGAPAMAGSSPGQVGPSVSPTPSAPSTRTDTPPDSRTSFPWTPISQVLGPRGLMADKIPSGPFFTPHSGTRISEILARTGAEVEVREIKEHTELPDNHMDVDADESPLDKAPTKGVSVLEKLIKSTLEKRSEEPPLDETNFDSDERSSPSPLKIAEGPEELTVE
ncbi:hypothetical protein BIW11_10344, partial [Tropilaelaps mercedesae]